MTTVDKDRRSALDKLLGKVRKNEPEDAFAVFAAALQNAGINSKAFTKNITKKGVLEDMQAEVAAILGKYTDDAEAASTGANQAIAVIFGRIMEGVEGEPAEVETEPEMPPEDAEVISEVMAEDEPPPEDEEEMVGKELIIALAKETNATAKAIGEMAPAIVDIANFAKAAAPLVEQAQAVPELQKRIKELETALANQKAMAPRQASKDNGTVLTADNDGKLKEVIDEIRKGTEGNKVELGLKLKK